MSGLLPLDIERHAPVEVACPYCGHTATLSIPDLYRAFQKTLKPGAGVTAIRRAMVGPTVSECASCGKQYRWDLKAVRTYAATSARLEPGGAEVLSLGGQS